MLYDSFTAADGTDLVGHAPDICPAGSAWTNGYGTFQIESDTATAATSTVIPWGGALPASYIYIDSTISNFTLSAQYYFTAIPPQGYYGLGFRCADANNLWVVVLSNQLGLIQLFNITSGTAALIDSQSTSVTTGGLLKIVCSGTSISASYNGGTAVSTTSSVRQTDTLVGMFIPDTDGFAFDNFLVQP